MNRIPDDDDEGRQFNDLRTHLRTDKELRAFLKRFLTKRPLEEQAKSIQKVVATGIPVVGDSAAILQQDKGALSNTDKQLLASVGDSLVDELVWKRAAELAESRDQKVEGPQRDYLGPPFEDAILAMPEHFVDRQEDLQWLIERLEAGGTTGITALRGMGGVGKTTLAAAALREVKKRGTFPDGIAVVLCQDVTNSTEVLREVLTHFDHNRVPPRADDISGLTEVASRALEGKRTLVVLDNVEPDLAVESVVHPLRKAGATLLITARQVLPSTVVPAEGSYILDLLPRAKALELLLDSYGRSNIEELDAAQQAAARRIVDLLGCHTLAIKLAGSYAANANRDLASLANDLAGLPGAMGLPDGDTPGIMLRVFQQSTDALPQYARRLFFALPAFGSANFGRSAAIALARGIGVELPDAAVDLLVMRSLLDALVGSDLPQGADRERLRLHTLLRAFALTDFEKAPEAEQSTYYRIIAEFYASYLERVEEDGVEVDRININRALDWTIENRQSRLLVKLCLGMKEFWHKRWYTSESAPYLSRATEAADSLAIASGSRHDRLLAADLWLEYGQTLHRISKLDEAEEVFVANLQLRREAQDRSGEGAALFQLGRLFRSRGRPAEAQNYFMQGLEIYRELGDRAGEANCLGYLGRVAQARGSLNDAEVSFAQSLEIARQLHDRWGEGRVLNSLGQVALTRGRIAEAESYFLQALTLLREQGDQHGEGDVLTGLGRLAIDRGQWDKAERLLRDSLAIDREIQDMPGEGADLSQLAIVAVGQGSLAEADELVSESLPIRRKVQDRRGEGVDIAIQGGIALARGLIHEARNYYNQALTIAKEVENKRGEGDNLHQLGVIAQELGDIYQASDYFQQSLNIARQVESEPDVARALLSYGNFIAVHQGKQDDGCRMITEAVQLYRQMGRRELQRAEAVLADMGCV